MPTATLKRSSSLTINQESALRSLCRSRASHYRTELDLAKLRVYYYIGREIMQWIAKFGDTEDMWQIIREEFLTGMRWAGRETKCKTCLRLAQVISNGNTLSKLISKLPISSAPYNVMRVFHPLVPMATSRKMVDSVLNSQIQIYMSIFMENFKSELMKDVRAGRVSMNDCATVFNADPRTMVANNITRADRTFVEEVSAVRNHGIGATAGMIIKAARLANQDSGGHLLKMIQEDPAATYATISRLIMRGIKYT